MADFTSTTSSSDSGLRSSKGPINQRSLKKPLDEIASKVDLKGMWSNVQSRAQTAISSSEDFVKARPLRVVLGAAAVGFLAGMIARRRH
ncbi:DUF883 C-terminal domain-containing protein [Bdellovibrio sp. NC01]|uniref:DUF883 C-terminal domain-containing protein n=1 Tax=Bdellovibrio sp. NC01 TaxID=2220073 RepID=UPI00115BC06C|nr:DUF883 C-terminal domain-containing protein [Bdellovibrio sp. NC01]QDK36702.1 hypothetical protein DOE51_03340 [Bdellovibrio sp. NC01]